MSTRLQKHADLSLEQVLIDLHHSRRERLFVTKAVGTCEPTSKLFYMSCMGRDKRCKSSSRHPCQGLCRCNTVGIDECECVKSLSEPMVEDNTNAFVKVVHRASDDMVETGKAIISKANEYIDFAADVISDVVKRSISAIKAIVKKKIEEACRKLATTKEDVKEQREKVKQLRAAYKKSRHSKHRRRRHLKRLFMKLGANGMEQILAVKNILKLLRDFFMARRTFLLPDLLFWAPVTPALQHTPQGRN